ncbi:MAG TPA: DUF445 domain-containing protein [Roseiflexaceae bacterium]|nr:DUF445 domain-containing protein [Roseiflexaceae bacterium]
MYVREEQTRRAELVRMQRVATSLLALAALLFVLALRLQESYPWASFLRAAAEGAMVGGLADWFAVTALFRRPLGLPIPHTAIIPTRKDQLGASIGVFVRDNFLTVEVLVGRLHAMQFPRRLGEWLAQPEHAERVARLLAGGASGALQVVNDADVQAAIERGLVARIESTPVAPLVGRGLGALLTGRRRREALLAIVQLAGQLLVENRDAIRRKISEGAPWWMPPGVDRTIYTRMVETVIATLTELGEDPDHPLNRQFDAVVERFVARLQSDPELIARGESYKAELIGHPLLRELVASLWSDLKGNLLEQSRRDDSALRAAITRLVVQLGELLQRDEGVAAKVSQWAEGAVRYAAEEYGHEASELIAQTVSRWDATTMARRIELQVGPDLQFIRINGTLVGGLAGLAIYAVATVLG